ncbi:MAG: response regulator transcription factor [Alphaproteobacteria bacterium]|nr:response regulator transcription factor [Alphaproteobacteria bacterium]MCB9690556.1 response regulator transcription factor [Alphaproteobacteria bacterium]
MSYRILVVEDDPAICRGVEMNLQLEGFETLVAVDGRQALELLGERLDLVILDIMLPHVNGFEIVERLRRRKDDVPIILLSAKADEEDIVRGLDLGADDYVTKPFRLAELLARVKAHLRRRPSSTEARFGDVVIDFDERKAVRDGELVELTPKELDLLEFMWEKEGRALTRDTILQAVWGNGYFGTDRTVDNFINRLRRKLDTPAEPRHFVTVRGVGYRFVSEGE